ncbi:hypothetical protein [uncultured Rothia sp.]|uniref:hypothetical protein n=1 Tax=uncultured Rothia sp. TaxID=316088 RepID=UPI0032164A2F
MSSIFQVKKHHKFAYLSVSSLALLTLVLTGCASDDQSPSADTSSTSSTASPSSSTSAEASNQPTESASKEASPESSDAVAEGETSDISENYDGAEDLKSATAVALDEEHVQAAEDLYTNYGNVLQNVETQVETGDSEETAEDTPSEERTILTDQTIGKINEVATGSAADEFQASALEFGTSGWKQEGSTKFVGTPKIADTEYEGKPAKLLEVCIDSSDIVVKDAAGNALTSSETAKRSLNLFTLVEENGSWKIAYRAMPNNPDC